MLQQSESLQKQQDADRADKKRRQELEDQRYAQEQQRLQEDSQQRDRQFSQLMGMSSTLANSFRIEALAFCLIHSSELAMLAAIACHCMNTVMAVEVYHIWNA